MKAKTIDIIEFLQGNLTPDHYARVLNAKLIIQRHLKRTKPATEAVTTPLPPRGDVHESNCFSFSPPTPLPLHSTLYTLHFTLYTLHSTPTFDSLFYVIV